MNVIVFGASGAIGSAISAELLSRGHTVTGVSRSGHDEGNGVAHVVGDAADPERVAALVTGFDAVVSAVGPRHDGSEDAGVLATTTQSLLDGLRKAGVRRIVAVGGAGSLIEADGNRHLDNPRFPVEYKPVALAHAAALEVYRESDDLEWTYISPASVIEPGERTGIFRIGGDDLLVEADGTSRITIPDFAIGLADQVEKASSVRRRITLAY
jgi:uncharacterized protein